MKFTKRVGTWQPSMEGPWEQYVFELLANYGPKPRPPLTEEGSRAAWERLLRHAGAENLGYATGADNESIDADLAREYGSTHEEQV